jgi:hypothetical protein
VTRVPLLADHELGTAVGVKRVSVARSPAIVRVKNLLTERKCVVMSVMAEATWRMFVLHAGIGRSLETTPISKIAASLDLGEISKIEDNLGGIRARTGRETRKWRECRQCIAVKPQTRCPRISS